ncbi:MAG: hypothetical protein R3258_03830 [Acidimicrobiia bacterium]|nr:hypothetical protein [Acidimicrobiia bacterium]
MTEPQRREEELKAPFSFKLMIVLTVLYLGWRLVQGVVWLWERIAG